MGSLGGSAAEGGGSGRDSEGFRRVQKRFEWNFVSSTSVLMGNVSRVQLSVHVE